MRNDYHTMVPVCFLILSSCSISIAGMNVVDAFGWIVRLRAAVPPFPLYLLGCAINRTSPSELIWRGTVRQLSITPSRVIKSIQLKHAQ